MTTHSTEVVAVDGGFVARCLTCPSWSTEPYENEAGAEDAARWHSENGSRLSGEHQAIGEN